MLYNTLETQRLILTEITPSIFELAFQTLNDVELIKFFGLKDLVALEGYKDRYKQRMYSYKKSFVLFVLNDRSSNLPIGSCGFHSWYLQHKRAEIGYALNEEKYKKQGYMSEAMQAILNYGFETMKLNRVEAFIGENNLASINLVKKFGFEKEGLHKQHYIDAEGAVHDSLCFALVKKII